MRTLTDILELADVLREVSVLPEEYARLLGYPKGWTLEGRPLELAEWARAWYAQHGRPWIYARQAQSFSLADGAACIDGATFRSKRLEKTLRQAEAHSVILAAVSAGVEAEEEARRRWEADRPDEYFFLEIYGSAVVEHLTALAGARLCDWAEQNRMAVLPHASPGYPEWDVAQQPQLLALLEQIPRKPLPGPVEVLESGMLRPKKTQLAVFGLTRHTDRMRRLTELNPCESCTFGPCRYRRAPYRRPPRSCGEPAPAMAVLDRDARYSVNRKALARWAAERLSLETRDDGSLDAVFRCDGTTCTNMGHPLAFDYRVKLGPREEGYPIREQQCAPAAGDSGYTHMCQYVENPEGLMEAIAQEKPLRGEKLNAVLAWQREPAGAGCHCTSASRDHKWGLAFETIHYALVQREQAQGGKEDRESQ
ncbi:MAG TPA: hypothetical protein VHX37_01375 [Acidobacteriaceae bacterium]|jgi:hypothetical protein|nr:hypothetical protein [Acidobacteriaceae bacterium]